MTNGSEVVIAWWLTLGAISIVNVWAWIVVAAWHRRGVPPADAEVHAARRSQLVLSALFVVGCAFRSVFPRAEAQRICLFDSWISSAVIARMVATVAELALVSQWALLLNEAAKSTRATLGIIASRLMVPMIGFAEVWSWYTALTTNFIGSVIEESTWATTSMLMTLAFVQVWKRHAGRPRRFIGGAILLNVAYIVFMWTVDVPMYWSRLQADRASGKQMLSVGQGWVDAARRRIVTHRLEDWRQEIPWMTLYFSVGVWASIAMVRAPSLKKGA
jgi:hypothetical protein